MIADDLAQMALASQASGENLISFVEVLGDLRAHPTEPAWQVVARYAKERLGLDPGRLTVTVDIERQGWRIWTNRDRVRAVDAQMDRGVL